MPSLLSRTALQLGLAFTLALALTLSALPLDQLFRSAGEVGGGGTGMSAPVQLIADGTLRPATPASAGSSAGPAMLAAPASSRLTTAPRRLRRVERVAPPAPPATRLIALGRLQDDGG